MACTTRLNAKRSLLLRNCTILSLSASLLLASACSGDENSPEEDIPEQACNALVGTCHSDKWVMGSAEDECHTLGHLADEPSCRSRYTECTNICIAGKEALGEDVGHGGEGHGDHGDGDHGDQGDSMGGHGGEGHGDHAGDKGGQGGEGHGDHGGGMGGQSDHTGGMGGHGDHAGGMGGHGGEGHGGEGHGGEGHGGEGHGGEGHGGEQATDSKCALIADTCAKLESEEAAIKECVSLGQAKDEAKCDAGLANCRTMCGEKLCGALGNVCHGGEGKAAECHDLGHDGEAGLCFDGALACYATCDK